MKNIIALLILSFTASCLAGPPLTWEGATARLFTQTICLRSDPCVTGGSQDPSVTATSAPAGTIFMRTSGSAYIKQDAGLSTNWTIFSTGSSSGTVTSVALTLPASVFSISGSPVTTSGTLTGAFQTQTANTLFAGPITGGAVAPTFRTLVAADIPSLDASKITTGTLGITNGGTGQATANAAFNALAPSQATHSGQFLTTDGTNTSWASVSGGSGTVTSVDMTVPSILAVSGNPITTSGTLALSLTSEALNSVFAGPATVGAGTPTFRALTSGDIPWTTLNSSIIPTADDSFDLGNSVKGFSNVYAHAVKGVSGAQLSFVASDSSHFISFNADTMRWRSISGDILELEKRTGFSTTDNGTVTGLIFQNGFSAANFALQGLDASGATKGLVLGTGASTGGGTTGDTTIVVGSTSGTQGKIRLKDASVGTVGHVWTSTDTTGGGHWAAASGGTVFSDSAFRVQDNGDATKQLAFEVSAITTGTTRTWTVPDSALNFSTSTAGTFATNTLNNLGTTAVNANINPGSNNTRDLGDGTNNWKNVQARDFIAYDTTPTDQLYVSANAGDMTFPDSTVAKGAVFGNQLGQSYGFYTISGSTKTSDLLYETGNETGATGATGSITIKPGNNTSGSSSAVSGSTNISGGNNSGTTGTGGSVNLTAGTGNTPGAVNTVGLATWSAGEQHHVRNASGTTVTVATTDWFVAASNAAARTVNLPACVTGQELIIKDTAGTGLTANVTINRAGSDTIDGATSTTIMTNFGARHLVCTGTDWSIVNTP